MKILITGGCGFVGSNLAILFKDYLNESDIYCFDNLSRRGSEINLAKILAKGIHFIHGDVRIASDFEKIPQTDWVIDAAAEPSVLAGKVPGELENLIETNFNGTIHTLNYCRKWGAKFLFLSTSRVYPYDSLNAIPLKNSISRLEWDLNFPVKGLSSKGINEDFELKGLRSLYGATKLSSEYFVQEYAHNFGIPSVINRCGVLTGPHQMGKIDQGVIVLWVAKHFWNKKLSYIGFGGEGKQVRDMLHVKDLFQLLIWEIQHIDSIKSEIFNVGGGLNVSTSLLELTAYCEELTGNKIQIDSDENDRPGDIPIYLTDTSKIEKLSGWKPIYQPKDILKEIVEWIEEDQKMLFPILS